MPWSLNVIAMIGAAALPFEFYAANRISTALAGVTGWPRPRLRLALYLVIFYPILYPLISAVAYSIDGRPPTQRAGMFWNDLLMCPFWCGIVFIVQLGIIFIVVDAFVLVLRLVAGGYRDRIRLSASWLMLALTALTPLYCAYCIRTDLFSVKVARTSLTVAGLPKELDGLKIAQITDVHVDDRTNGAKLANYIDTVNRFDPDIVIFCGDLISSGTSYVDEAAAALGKLKAKHGLYACLGDHDYFTDPDLVATALERNGITVIRNSVKVLPIAGASVSLTGLTNVYVKRPTQTELKTLEAARPMTTLDIFFTHQPSNSLVSSAVQSGYPLVLAGHTHGGQIVFPMPGFLLTGSSFETHYVTGFFKQGPTLISICNGLGMTLAPIRYQAPAEINLIDISAGGR